jgi:hypothetical protein
MPDLAPLLALLDAHHVAHLATAGDGGPHAAPVFFARVDDGAAITWISAPHVLHSRHLAASGAAAASVGPSAPPLGLIEGAQLRGYAHALDEVYGRFLFHGPGFQVIRHVVGADNAGMEATLSGTHDMNWPTNGWLTDLAAFDGGLQLALLWNRLHTDAASLPTAIGAFRAYGAPAPGPVRCVLTGRRLAGRAVASDLAFVDASGTVFAALDGVETHALPSGAFPTAAR